jgi:hypothetical protein
MCPLWIPLTVQHLLSLMFSTYDLVIHAILWAGVIGHQKKERLKDRIICYCFHVQNFTKSALHNVS